MNRTPVAQTFLSAGLRDILVPYFRNWGLASPQNPAMRDWKACPTSRCMAPMRVQGGKPRLSMNLGARAGLKSPQSRRRRVGHWAGDFAKRLECGALTAASGQRTASRFRMRIFSGSLFRGNGHRTLPDLSSRRATGTVAHAMFYRIQAVASDSGPFVLGEPS
jgi:hypothetical protein